ncbi:MAG TPA: diaminopimelate decarboxylase, partial [bacterium]|nr:diaminopimelate decarboxylase [bacterium]
KRFGSPLFIYSKAALLDRARAFRDAFAPLGVRHHLALKANDNLTLLHLLREEGFGADCVSGGELQRAEAAGFEGHQIVFNGNGKSDRELILAHRMDIALIVADALFELGPLAETAAVVGRDPVPMAIRLNPAIDPVTHPYLATGLETSKFGLPPADLPEAIAFLKANPQLQLRGLHTHLGSLIADPGPYLQSAQFLMDQAAMLRAEGFPVDDLSLGGGFAVPYADGEAFDLAAFVLQLMDLAAGTDFQWRLEPGRYLFAETACLATTVLGHKTTEAKHFLVVDAGMTDNIRPALYHARHPVVPVVDTEESTTVDLVGPVCESGDFLALDIGLPLLERGAMVAQLAVGAYSYAMQSRYNGRPRPPECLVSGNAFELIRDRESVEDLGRRDLYFPN